VVKERDVRELRLDYASKVRGILIPAKGLCGGRGQKILATSYRMLPFLALVVFVGLGSQAARAQGYLTQIGVPPFTTAEPVELGAVNVANGNLRLAIPIGSFPQRGGRRMVTTFVYDSAVWQRVGISSGNWLPTNVANSWGGWRFVNSASPGTPSGPNVFVDFCGDGTPGNPKFWTYGGFSWRDPGGTLRLFNVETTKDPNNCSGAGDVPSAIGYAGDASGYQMSVTNYSTISGVFAPDGTQVYPAVKDTNGNFFSTDANGNVIDTLGRKPVTVTTNCNSNPNQICYDVLNSQGTSSRYTITTQSISVKSSFGQSGFTEYTGSITVVQSILLPDSTTYQFSYDSGTTAGHYGTLTGITLPTGGPISYGYTTYLDSQGSKYRWVSSRSSGGGNWSYTPAIVTSCALGCQQKVTVLRPSGDNTIYVFTLNNGAWRSEVDSYTGTIGTGSLLSIVASTWDFTAVPKIRLLRNSTTLPTPGGSFVTSKTEMAYANTFNSNVASVKSWKFYAGSSPTFPTTPDRETDFVYHASFGSNIANRVSQTTTKGSGGSVLAQTNYTYDDTGSLLPSTPATGIQSHDDTNYGISRTVRGNLTTVQRCTVFTACSSNNLQTSTTYDTTGQVLSVKDPKNNVTTFGYTDSFFSDVGDGPLHPPQPYPVSPATNAYVTTVSPPLVPASTMGYYYGTGQAASVTDANAQTIYSHFFDGFSRPTSAVFPNGGWAYNVYSASETQLDSYTGITGAFASSGCTGCRQDEVLLDNLGRATAQKLISDPEGITTVTTNYDTTGRVLSASHPARTTGSSTDGVETPTYDGLGRAIKITHQNTTFSQTFYGAAVSGSGAQLTQLCSSTTYGLGYPTLMVDEAGKKREVWTDGFGRTIEADEPDSSGNLTSNTCYKYDSLSNLLQIAHGAQTRTYAYDTLLRVSSISIPELADSTGTHCSVTYTYDNNSNVLTQTAPAPNQTSCTTTVTITFSYDALNRLAGKTYSDGSPAVKYGYDNTALTGCTTIPPALTITNPKDRRTSMCDSSGAASWSYDSMGRVVAEGRTILGITKNISYSYNLDGSVAAVTYPNNKVITYTASNAQRPTLVRDVTNNVQFATAVSYSPPGGLQGMITGQISGGFGGVTESHTYNSSLEYTSTQAASSAGTAMNLTVSYSLPGGDNGSVNTVTNNVDNGRTQSFTYDPLNRILSAKSSATSGVDCWGQNFGPDGQAADDAVANLVKINSGTQTPPLCAFGLLSATVDANNHINTDATFAYDAVGNMTKEGNGAGYLNTFDDEGRLTLATGPAGGPYCYVYDGNGLRVAKKSGATSCTLGTVTKLYWRSITGDALAETDSTGNTTNTAYHEYVFFDGRRIASRDGTGAVFYFFADHLGSTRTVTNAQGQLCYDAEFTPYGQEISHTERLQTTACPPNYRFTGYEYDSETTNYYAFARYYNPRLGRFLSTDPLGGAIGDLQSHNAYAYVINNPLSFTDPSGLVCSADFAHGDTPCNSANSGGPDFASLLGWAAGVQSDWLGSGSIPGYSVVGGHVFLYIAYTINVFFVGDLNDGVYGYGTNGISQLLALFDLGPQGAARNPGGGNNSDGWAWTFTKSFFTTNPFPTAWESLKSESGCGHIIAETFLKDLSPVPLETSPSVGDAIPFAGKATAAAGLARASAYSVSRGLVQPLKSGTFRALRGSGIVASTAVEELILPATIVYAGADALVKSVSSAAQGDCH
jgi:RHS repeat-associated protein